MFRHPFKKDEETALDVLIADVLSRMKTLDPCADEYTDLMLVLKNLQELKDAERPPRVSEDTKMIVIGNLLGILLIIAYEQKHAITSKGFQQILRLKTPIAN